METTIKEGLYRSPRSGRVYNAVQVDQKVMVEVIRSSPEDVLGDLKKGDVFEFGPVSNFPEYLYPYSSKEEIEKFHGAFPESLRFD